MERFDDLPGEFAKLQILLKKAGDWQVLCKQSHCALDLQIVTTVEGVLTLRLMLERQFRRRPARKIPVPPELSPDPRLLGLNQFILPLGEIGVLRRLAR